MVNPNMASSEEGQVAVRELCEVLEATISTLTQMTGRMDEDDMRPALLPSDTKSLEFIRAVLKHSLTPSKITDLMNALWEMRVDVQACLTKLETTSQHVHTLYDIMNNRLARIESQGSTFSTSTNLTARIKLVAWLKKWEGSWRPSRQRETTPVSHSTLLSDTVSSHYWLQSRDFSTPTAAKVATRPTMDPLSLSASVASLAAIPLKVAVGSLGLTDATIAAKHEAAHVLKGLQQDLEHLRAQMVRIYGVLKVLTSDTKDRGFKKLLQE